MKKVASIVLSALLFGVIAGASMVGINVAAQKAGITNQTVQESQALIESPKASTGTNGEAAGGASGKSGADQPAVAQPAVAQTAVAQTAQAAAARPAQPPRPPPATLAVSPPSQRSVCPLSSPSPT